jgi:hypothetical protein
MEVLTPTEGSEGEGKLLGDEPPWLFRLIICRGHQRVSQMC